jgi:murein DD-endopeptidase MepM/ murein hydrolase activator NlpD
MGRASRFVAAAAAALVCAAPASALTDGASHPTLDQLASVNEQVPFVWPAQGTVTTVFGHTEGRWHPGLDIGILRDLTIRAAAPGVVEAVGFATGFEGYGNIVLVRVGPEIETLYAHLSSVGVHVGDVVAQDQQLGVAGCTGYCTGTHLHFEVRRDGKAVDPMRWLASGS